MASTVQPSIRVFTRGDTLVSLYARLDKADGTIPALTGTTVFWMKLKSKIKDKTYECKVVGAPARVINSTTREVAYDWNPADVDTAADYYGWFVNHAGGKTEHFPGQGAYLIVKFVEAEGDQGS